MTAAPRKILILDGHSKAAAASVLALPRNCKLHVAATNEDCLCFSSPRVDERLSQPHQPTELRGWLHELYARERYDLIIPSTEASLLAVKAQGLDEELRTRCVLAPEPSLDIALDKQRTLELAEQLGIRIPTSTLATSMETATEPAAWPAVAKPAHSKIAAPRRTFSLQPRICSDAQTWREALGEFFPWSAVITQEYFRGYGVGVEALFEHGEPRWLFAHRRIHERPVTGGASTYRRAIEVPAQLRHATLELLGQLRWHGVAMVEFKLADDGDYRLMEINPRLWGSLPLAIAAGVNFPLGLLQLATGSPVGPQPKYRHCYARDAAKDLHWFEDSLRERHNPLRLSPLRLRDVCGWLRPLIGRESWDLFRWREPQMWWHTVQPAVRGIRARLLRRAVRRRTKANWRRLSPAWREGHIQHVLVLCHGNICRSPVVAKLLHQRLPGATIESAGFHTNDERTSPDVWMRVVADSLGVDLHQHRSRTVDAEAAERAELILVMDSRNWSSLARNFPDALRKAVLLGVTAPADNRAEIRDPHDDDPTGMLAVATQLESACIALAGQYGLDAH